MLSKVEQRYVSLEVHKDFSWICVVGGKLAMPLKWIKHAKY